MFWPPGSAKLITTSDSDVLSITLPGHTIILLNSFKAAPDLMEKRSRIYSDKTVPVMTELYAEPAVRNESHLTSYLFHSTGWDWGMATLRYGSRWRDRRRAFHQHFNQAAIKQYNPIQTRETRAFLKRALTFSDRIDIVSVSQYVYCFARTVIELL